MSQQFKSVYFADGGRKRSISLAFGVRDELIYSWVSSLGSQEMRDIIGHDSLASLKNSAGAEGLSPATYCVSRLRRIWNRREQEDGDAPTKSGANAMILDPLQATFRGGSQEPLHEWYPYLEGYSPTFVETVLSRYAPNACRILDPFGGGGTTPITVARQGKQGFFAELNPLLQTITAAKTTSLKMTESQRRELAAQLTTIADTLADMLPTFEPARELANAYTDVFGKSQFFSEAALRDILRARTYIDYLYRVAPVASIFVQVAALSSLVPASFLIRRGDLRFKTPEEQERSQEQFTDSLNDYLHRIAADVMELSPLSGHTELVAEDARHLAKLPPMNIEAVVTSPPYLNGTNYFRNTKLELWFLRVLRTNKDLAAFRLRAVTAGINDVTVGKSRGNGADNPRLLDILRRLEAEAYDRRIPQMVASYYTDMEAIIAAVKPHLTAEAPFIIDIGDSAYGNIHVPTDKLLSDIAERAGLVAENAVPLRKRLSRGGFELQQLLLVFRNRPSRQRVVRDPSKPIYDKSGSVTERWARFKEELPHQQGDFAKRNWGHPLHSLCSYQGKMKPSLAANLVQTFVPEGGTVLDPFGGVGTIPFEASLHGMKSWCFDISPAALHISAAKLSKADAAVCRECMESLEEATLAGIVTEEEYEQAACIRFNGPLPDYFNPETFREILAARRFFLMQPPRNSSESLVFAALLHILHGNRPYALSRRSHPITPFAPTGEADYRPLMPRLRDKVERSLAAEYPTNFAEGAAIYQDATSWWPQTINNLDAVITSPPFFDSTRFYLANWMRLWFCGWEAQHFQSEPLAFVDERQKASFGIYESIFRQARERLKSGGVMVLHLGESRKCDMAEALTAVARPWFRVKDRFIESVAHCESHGIRDKGTVTAHQYLVLG